MFLKGNIVYIQVWPCVVVVCKNHTHFVRVILLPSALFFRKSTLGNVLELGLLLFHWLLSYQFVASE
jgi:hypothetical protein